MRVKVLSLLFIVVTVISIPAQSVMSAEKVSFVGADGDAMKGPFDHVDNLQATGINIYGVEHILWDFIEPNPPQNGVHRYEWAGLDEVIRKIEAAGGRTHMTINCVSTWATRLRNRSRVASPPEGDRWDDYEDFVRALVERYDNDGVDDMPGLKYAHLYYQVLDEAENASSWDGTVEEYIRLLKLSREGARRANPNVRIFTFSPNLGDLFDHLSPRESQTALEKISGETEKFAGKGKAERKIAFIKKVFEEQDSYDVISLQYNYHYTGLPGVVGLVRKFSSKPIWIADAASVTLLGRHRKVKAEYTKNTYPYLSEREIGDILSNPSHPRFEEVRKWWETEQARTTFKKIVTAASLGMEHLFVQFMRNQRSKPMAMDQAGVNPWNLAGIMDDDGDLRPVSNTIRLFHEKFQGFSAVEDLTQKKAPPEEWFLHYRFRVGEKTLDVLWTDGEERKVTLPSKGRVSITHIIEGREWPARTESSEKWELVIGRSPIIVEAWGSGL